jgi:hypothetical protein
MSALATYVEDIPAKEAQVSDEKQEAREKRVQAYVTEATYDRLRAIAHLRSDLDKQVSLSELASTIIDDWLATHPEEVERANRLLKSRK